MKRRTFGTVVLLLSVFQPQYALSPVMSDLSRSFPDVPQGWMMQMLSLPLLVSIPATLACGRLSRHVPGKTLLLLGILLATAGGVLPLVLDDFPLLLLARGLVGIGIGFVFPFTLSLIADFFEGPLRDTLYGLQGSFVSIGGMLFSTLGGIVGVLGWRTNSLVPLLGIPFFLAALSVLPAHPPVAHPTGRPAYRTPRVWALCAAMALVQALVCVFGPNVSYLLDGKGLGGSDIAGLVITAVGVGGLVGGFLFGPMHRVAGRSVFGTSMAAGAAGLLLAAAVPHLWAFFCGALLIGFAGSTSVSAGVVRLSTTVPPDAMTSVMSMGMAAICIGVAAGPALSGILRGRYPALTLEALFAGCSALLLLGAVATVVHRRTLLPGMSGKAKPTLPMA